MLTQRPKNTAVEIVVYGIMFLSFAVLFSLDAHYISNSPKTPDAQSGQVYPLDNHGKIMYLTEAENKKELLAKDAFFGIWILSAGFQIANWGLKKLSVS